MLLKMCTLFSANGQICSYSFEVEISSAFCGKVWPTMPYFDKAGHYQYNEICCTDIGFNPKYNDQTFYEKLHARSVNSRDLME